MTGILQSLLGSVSSAVSAVTDAYFNLVTLLLPGNGTNGAQNNTFLDSSTNNFTITRNGNTTQGTFSPFSQTGWGLRTNDRSLLSIPASGDFDLINTDFTIEFWFNLNAFNTMSGSGNNFFGNGLATATNGWGLSFGGSGTTATSIEFGVWNSAVYATNSFTGLTLNMGTWYHIVLQRNGTSAGNLRLFVNGVLQGSAQNSQTYSTAGSTFTFGSGAYTQNGTYSGNADYYISNVRLTKSAVYSTSGFTSPTSNLSQLSGTTLLICQSNRLVNNGTNTGAITSDGYTATRAQVVAFSPFLPTAAYSAATVGGSGYFDGTGDFLSFPTNSVLVLGSGNFTVEAWIYPTATVSSTQTIVGSWDGTTTLSWNLSIFATNAVGFEATSSGSYVTPLSFATANNALIPNSWNHIAVVRSGNAFTMYINGVSSATATNSITIFSAPNNTKIGSNTNNQHFLGYIAGTRIVVGTAVYTGAFTVPTSPFTPTMSANPYGGSNTSAATASALLNYTNAGITDATAKNDLETVGNAQISTTQSKFGGSSMSFDGTGDYIVEPTNLNFGYGTGDFTIEFWLRLNSTATQTIVSNLTSASSVNPHLYILLGGSIRYYTNNADRITGSTLSTGQWYHVALCRSGTSTKLFIDGTQSGSTYTDSNNYGATAPLGIGTYWSSGTPLATDTLNGYIDDLRISKYARYTANFTAPTAAFPLQ